MDEIQRIRSRCSSGVLLGGLKPNVRWNLALVYCRIDLAVHTLDSLP